MLEAVGFDLVGKVLETRVFAKRFPLGFDGIHGGKSKGEGGRCKGIGVEVHAVGVEFVRRWGSLGASLPWLNPPS